MNFLSIDIVQKALRDAANPEKAKLYAGYFRTGKGEYGEGDKFLGITVPIQRKIARQFTGLPLVEISKLLKSDFHEDRFTALVILQAKNPSKEIAKFYLAYTKYINNWDLVDTSAPRILGPVADRAVLYKLAKSRSLWERRIAIITTGYYIWQSDFNDTLKISEMLLGDPHHLIHKAVGWMLREIGKRNLNRELEFLNKHHRKMPRTMLRYSIERLDREKKSYYLNKS